ncbi:bifunctional metallophosphatase/5'-nucleotidase [Azotosporobacter soli]|uniref:bifunctional metallophosphatase/5'-nucleotidase n=1 Tax=Azotosporobacter soli TaxID=3055040 RepID=UPI0031FE7EF2
MQKLKKTLLALCLVAVCLTFWTAAATAEENGDQVELQIVSVNDFHGALIENGKNPGAAKLAAYLKALRAKNPDGTLLLSGGDMFQGSVESNLLYGKPVVEFMNEVAFDAMAFGNHEFDWGIERLEQRIAQANFPYLGANILLKDSAKAAPFAKDYQMLERKGVHIAVIGLATPQTAYMTNPKAVGAYQFADPVERAKALLPQLKAKGADLVVVVSHLGSYQDKESRLISDDAARLAAGVPSLNAIVSGHTHQTIFGKVGEVPIVQAYYFGRAVGEIDLTYDKKSRQVTASVAKVSALNPAELTADPAVAAIVAKAEAEVAPIKQVVLGETLRELHHERSEQNVSLLGQWSSDVLREAAKADIAFQNGGGIRTSIPAGLIKMGNLYEIMPFDNTLFTVDLTGEQVMQVLQYGIHNSKIGMLQYAGLKVQYDASLPPGERIVAVTTLDGQALDKKRGYRVATNDFMALGGDGYSMFKEGKNLKDSNIPLRDILVEKIKALKVIDFSGDDRLIEIRSEAVGRLPAAA